MGAWFILPANFAMVPMQLFSLWRASGRAATGGGGLGRPGVLLGLFLGNIALILLAFVGGVLLVVQSGGTGDGPGPALFVGLGVVSLVSGLLVSLFWWGLARYVENVQEADAAAR